eukprot:4231653-Pyramimonas_sp.AAC.1
MQCVMTCRPILYWILYRCEVTLEVTEGSRKPRKEENQHYSAMTSDKSPTCLLVLCGLPAAGKTSIARRLVDYIQQTDELGGVHNDVDTRWMPYLTLCHYYQTRTRAIGNKRCATPAITVHHVCFDDIEADLIGSSSSETPGGFLYCDDCETSN